MTPKEPSKETMVETNDPGGQQPMSFDQALDARGLTCPEPLMLVRNAVRELASGQVLYVQATDPSTARDLQNFCRFVGHELLNQNVHENHLEFWIRRA